MDVYGITRRHFARFWTLKKMTPEKLYERIRAEEGSKSPKSTASYDLVKFYPSNSNFSFSWIIYFRFNYKLACWNRLGFWFNEELGRPFNVILTAIQTSFNFFLATPTQSTHMMASVKVSRKRKKIDLEYIVCLGPIQHQFLISKKWTRISPRANFKMSGQEF